MLFCSSAWYNVHIANAEEVRIMCAVLASADCLASWSVPLAKCEWRSKIIQYAVDRTRACVPKDSK